MKARRYWLLGGTERCEFCLHTYVREAEYRCAGCDGGFCEQCVMLVRDTLEWFCTGCREQEGTC